MISRYFGGWENALNQAGIKVIPKYISYDEKDVIAEIRRVYFEHFENSRMSRVKFLLHSKISYGTLWKYFRHWESALNGAEINYKVKSLNSDQKREQIMVDLYRIKDSNQNQYFSYKLYKEKKGR